MRSISVNSPRRSLILVVAAAAVSAPLYLLLALAGDLRNRPLLLAPAFVLLLATMLVGYRAARGSRAVTARWVLGAALLFRLLAVWGEPALSDDVYRYVWDGRVQQAGHHPYAHAPLAPELAGLRDERVWPRINHPELRTIYPPGAQALFLALAWTGAGPLGFRLAFALADFIVVLALAALIARLGAPSERLVLYAWNPLAVLETAGSGHVEPVGVLLLLLALGSLLADRGRRAAGALAGAVQIKLLPLVAAPAVLRRVGMSGWITAVAVVLILALPYALTGPALGGGLFAYADSWEYNALVYPLLREGIEWLDPTPAIKTGLAAAQARLGGGERFWDLLYAHVWPPDLARLLVGTLALAWVLVVTLRLRPADVARETLLVLGGILLLSPTVHPWYVLWILPLAALRLDRGWLAFAALVPLTYVLPGGGDVAPWVRLVEYAPLLLWIGWRYHAGDVGA